MPVSPLMGSLTHKLKYFIIHLRENGLNKKDVFFPGIEESVIRFSVRCKENELHRK